MATTRTRSGARSYLTDIQHACKMSKLPGFRTVLDEILGGEDAAALMAVWTPFCAAVDALVAIDNWYNQRDYHQEVAGSEDIVPA